MGLSAVPLPSKIKTVRAAATGNVVIATALENGDALDGITLATGDRVLLPAQTTPAENGIYVVKLSGSPSRAGDFDSQADVLGSLIVVQEGTANLESIWLCTNNAPLVVGATGLTFAFVTVRKSIGTATVASAATETTVTHGAGYTPDAANIHVMPTNSPTNDPGHWWIDTIGATQFKIKVRTDPGASGATFAWRVDR